MNFCIQLLVAPLLALLPTVAAQDTDATALPLDNAKARQAAVETSLLTRTWVDGHTFGLTERMRILDVPGVSVAVIHNGQIDWAAGYGVRDETSGLPVTTETLFQAASISKPISALAVLRLAQEGRLDLDAPIQDVLTSFQLPASEFAGDVTPRTILNHTAGLNVDGFAGYRAGETVPTVAELLAGRGNSEPLRRVEPAGRRVRYSGGGSTLLQLALTDLAGQEFDALVRELVLDPLGMTHSTYAQPLSETLWPDHSAAHDHVGRRITGGAHVYPEQFPAGLWTTPSDIARFAIEMQRVAGGDDGQVLSANWGRVMLTPVFGRAALGLFIGEFGGARWFQHSGSNQGFKCDFRASFEGGHGVIVMTNGELGFDICQEVIRAVAKVYDWPGVIGEPLEVALLPDDQLQHYVGHYALSPDEVVFITTEDRGLLLQQLPYPRMPLAPLGDHRFQIVGTDFQVNFQGEELPSAESLSMSMEPDRLALRMAQGAYCPVQDLLLGDAAVAVARYREMHEIDAANPIVSCDRLLELTVGLAKFGRPESALALSKAVVELYADHAGAWDVLGQVNAQLGHREAALEAYRSCVERIPHDVSLDAAERARLDAHTRSRVGVTVPGTKPPS